VWIEPRLLQVPFFTEAKSFRFTAPAGELSCSRSTNDSLTIVYETEALFSIY
jgi:hypothetical protein